MTAAHHGWRRRLPTLKFGDHAGAVAEPFHVDAAAFEQREPDVAEGSVLGLHEVLAEPDPRHGKERAPPEQSTHAPVVYSLRNPRNCSRCPSSSARMWMQRSYVT